MDEILEVLVGNGRATPEEIAKLTGKNVAQVKKLISKYETDGTIVKYKAILNTELIPERRSLVTALIEVCIDPQEDAGFDRVAERIYNFPEVTSCYLVSGDHDLLVVVEGDSLNTVADFIASKLAPMAHVRSTRTHFLLKKYKEDGQILKKGAGKKRLNISY